MHSALRARHSLAVYFAIFAGSNVEALDPIVELEQAKREMGGLGGGKGVQIVGDWWMEGGMGVVDVGETAVVHVGESALPGPRCFLRRRSGENVQKYGYDAERYEGDTCISPIHIQTIQLAIPT